MAKETATVDLDDLVIQSAGAIVTHYEDAYGVQVPLEHFYSKDPSVWGVSDPDVAIGRVYKFYETEEYANLEPTPDALEHLPVLARYFDLHISTGRPDFLRPTTEAALEKHLPGVFVDLHFTNYTSPSDGPAATRKSEIARKVGARWHADDHIAHVADVANVGIPTFLGPDYPWNQTPLPLPRHTTRIKGWHQIAEQLLDRVAA